MNDTLSTATEMTRTAGRLSRHVNDAAATLRTMLPAPAKSGTAAVFRHAATLIRQAGWRQDNPADCTPYVQLTADQAVTDAARAVWNDDHGTPRLYSAAWSQRDDFTSAALDSLAGWLIMTGQHDASYCTFKGATIVAEWNDTGGRTGGQVLAALSQAADVLEVRAALGVLEGGEAA
jgi:hypothetical protein